MTERRSMARLAELVRRLDAIESDLDLTRGQAPGVLTTGLTDPAAPDPRPGQQSNQERRSTRAGVRPGPRRCAAGRE